ncbi:NB-ARC domain-containing protein [Nostoc sp. FACHB-110]|uniref:NB-ARC domain-containing protein n=1 Tax=Nostoc sp. FACHB-110 TaxID=2692834 RepID=UPI001688DEC5|nr:NB-ARC domain-containing protein [Nostoc sp. FACHB-110]MBD2438467.1 hypothetical protein [Nostoc sp. FACHB-110]
MSNSLKASTTGLAIVEKARKRLGWTKTSTARWWQDAHTSRATLRRFWQGDRIQHEIFIAICQAVGIQDWQSIADISDADSEIILEPSKPYLDWYEAPDVESFFGRNLELEQLEEWIISDRYKLITIVGIAGIGKTALLLALADRIQTQFDCLIWRSLYTAPSLISLLENLLNIFEQTVVNEVNKGTAKLIHHLQQRRCLLILDGLDTVELTSEYNRFFHQLSRHHKSCVFITSREQPKFSEIQSKTANCWQLKGLSNLAALELLQSRGFTGKELGLPNLIQLYRGNPLALKLVTPLIQSVFGGNVAAFINQHTLVISDRLQIILKQQFEQLSDLEQDIVYWLAIWQEPVTFCRLQTHLLISVDPSMVLAGILALERRALLEKWVSSSEVAFTLQPMVMKVVTDELVENAAQEIHQVAESYEIRHFKILRTHWLLRPGSDDIIGDRILYQLQEKLWRMYGAFLPQALQDILLLLKDKSPLAIGYIASNITTLLNCQQ